MQIEQGVNVVREQMINLDLDNLDFEVMAELQVETSGNCKSCEVDIRWEFTTVDKDIRGVDRVVMSETLR
jgi:hypothetical protein